MVEDPRQHDAVEPGGDAPDEERVGVEDVALSSPEDERVADLLQHTIDVPVLAEAVERQEAADAADTLETLEDEEAAEVLEQMQDLPAAQALAEMEPPLALGVMEELLEDDPAYAGQLIAVMAPDDAADLLLALEEPDRAKLLARIDPELAGRLVQLISYDEDSAGGIMTTDCLALQSDMTVQEAIEFIRGTDVPDTGNYALVTDEEHRLEGIIGLRKLLLAGGRDRLRDIMKPNVRVVRPDIDREQVAREFDRYDYSMLPVVDENERLLGIVTVDDVIDIIRQEQTEDVQRTVGAGAEEAVYSPIGTKFRGRFPWLIISTLLTCGAASIILLAEGIVAELPIVVFIMMVTAPLVGNAGHQSLAVTLRGLVLDEVRHDRVWPLIMREGAVGVLIGVVVGLVLFLLILLRQLGTGEAWNLAWMPLIALPVTMAIGTLTGSGVPLLMKRFGIDPAHASAILLIVITDAISFVAILGLGWVWVQFVLSGSPAAA